MRFKSLLNWFSLVSSKTRSYKITVRFFFFPAALFVKPLVDWKLIFLGLEVAVWFEISIVVLRTCANCLILLSYRLI